jgi:hypothetical protein
MKNDSAYLQLVRDLQLGSLRRGDVEPLIPAENNDVVVTEPDLVSRERMSENDDAILRSVAQRLGIEYESPRKTRWRARVVVASAIIAAAAAVMLAIAGGSDRREGNVRLVPEAAPKPSSAIAEVASAPSATSPVDVPQPRRACVDTMAGPIVGKERTISSNENEVYFERSGGVTSVFVSSPTLPSYRTKLPGTNLPKGACVVSETLLVMFHSQSQDYLDFYSLRTGQKITRKAIKEPYHHMRLDQDELVLQEGNREERVGLTKLLGQ